MFKAAWSACGSADRHRNNGEPCKSVERIFWLCAWSIRCDEIQLQCADGSAPFVAEGTRVSFSRHLAYAPSRSLPSVSQSVVWFVHTNFFTQNTLFFNYPNCGVIGLKQKRRAGLKQFARPENYFEASKLETSKKPEHQGDWFTWRSGPVAVKMNFIIYISCLGCGWFAH